MDDNSYNVSFVTIFNAGNVGFACDFSYDNAAFLTNFGSVTGYVSGETYQGDYTVTPTVDGIMLDTKGLIMTDDVTVKAIPYYQVTNPADGDTVYIGNEVI